VSTEITFLDAAIDDLGSIGPSNIPKILAKLELLETNPEAGAPLGGALSGFRKLVVGNNTWRIVYRVQNSEIVVCEVWSVGGRSDAAVYDEATSRVANTNDPRFATLSDVIERLGRTVKTRSEQVAAPEPMPEWLRDRLVETARIPRAEVAAMSGPEGLEAWTAYCLKQKPG
jgi:mRNA-degrading endonuclease RelE of RelBE toxin-antitoxin system